MPSPTHVFEEETLIPAPLERVFEFFSKAENLERITPSTLRFRILTPQPVAIHQGALIDYRLQLMGVPFRWRTLIDVWEPPHRFVDTQVKGPYDRWYHEHRFEAVPEGTRMYDRVEYRIKYAGPLEPLVHRFFVRPQVEAIFRFRGETILREFGSVKS